MVLLYQERQAQCRASEGSSLPPTEQMLADIFTKPLQGSLFRKFKDIIMGQKHINTLKTSAMSPSQERVGMVKSEKMVDEASVLVTDEQYCQKNRCQ